jgi:lipid-A-disaccharide synthase
LPFEAEFYREHFVPVRFVGHPLAGQIPMKPDAIKAKELLDLNLSKPVLCLMPGSRGGEVELMANLFLEVGEQVSSLFEDLQLVIPAANKARYRQLKTILSDRDQSNVKLTLQKSHLAMEASDAILLASGTTALEAMLFKKPMVVSYRLSRLTYALVRRFIKTPFVSIPNLLADEMLVPELIQDNASVTNLTHAVASALSSDKKDLLVEHFEGLHKVLALESGNIASKAIAELVG